MIGDWALIAALPVHAYQLTGSTLATGAMVAALLAPRLVLGSVAGVYVDRWDRRRTLIVANVLLVGNVLVLAVVSSAERLWVLFVVAAVQSSPAQLVRPLVQSATEDEFRGRVLGSLATTAALSTLVGTTVGGLLGDRVGIVTMLNVDGIVYCLAGIMVLFALRPAPAGQRARAV